MGCFIYQLSVSLASSSRILGWHGGHLVMPFQRSQYIKLGTDRQLLLPIFLGHDPMTV